MRAWWAFLTLALLAGAPIWAADAPKPSPDYVLGPGDTMDVTVTSHPGYDRSVIIQPDGKIFFPGVGEVKASGLTVPQLREKLLAGLEQQLNRPDLTISLRDIRSAVNSVHILGAVRSPNVLALQPKWRLTEALAAAGGPAPNADLSRVTVTRGGTRVITVDLSQAARTGRAEHNLELEPGDLVIIPEGSKPSVLVLGEVARPSTYGLEQGAKIMDALSLAGGPTQNADLSSATISRLGAQGLIRVDLSAVLVDGDLSKNVALEAGDTVHIPPTTRRVYVVGEVLRGGTYPLRGGEHLLDALLAAGGPTKDADNTKATLHRRSPDGKTTVAKFDVKKLFEKGDDANNPPILDGDVVFVPNRRSKRPITDYLNLLYPLTWIRAIVP